MTRKPGIVAHLGEESLLLPRAALEAHKAADRARSLLALLRRTRSGPEGPSPWPPREIAEALGEELAEMLVPLRMTDELRSATLARRLDSLLAEGEGPEDDFHRLLADLVQDLDRILDRQRPETVAGASTYRLEAADVPRVERFMAGISRTAAMKFDHPGLATTAARHGERLVLQNDIGTTEAQVLVVHVADHEVVLTYTDVHEERATFFQRLLAPFPIAWQDVERRTVSAPAREGLPAGASYCLVRGALPVAGGREVLRFLEHLGSRLVFLIDWNKARKRLRRLLRQRAALDLLDRAAREEWGHRAFLELGGEDLVRAALAAGGVDLAPTEPLHKAIGPNGSRELMARVLETCARRRHEGASAEEVREELAAEVRRRFGPRPERPEVEGTADPASPTAEDPAAPDALAVTRGSRDAPAPPPGPGRRRGSASGGPRRLPRAATR